MGVIGAGIAALAIAGPTPAIAQVIPAMADKRFGENSMSTSPFSG
jgi:hypothetical protein